MLINFCFIGHLTPVRPILDGLMEKRTLKKHGSIFRELPRIANVGYSMVYWCGMKTQSLKVKLTPELRLYVEDQVRVGRYQDENEVVRDAIRQMQQREIEQFERIFADYPGAPQGEPTTDDNKAIKAAINRHRDNRKTRQAA